MTQSLDRVFLDTNVYILGTINLQSYEAQILDWLGFSDQSTTVKVIVSEELTNQISRVSKRLKNKDWSTLR